MALPAPPRAIPPAPRPKVLTAAHGSLVAGACAGTAVDTLLFPLDTIKTRLAGFQASGGFRGIYAGLSSALIGSAPGAGMFFLTYDFLKRQLGVPPAQAGSHNADTVAAHMLAASGGEIGACVVRVPTEVVKQRMQTGQYTTFVKAVATVYKTRGFTGFYTGYATTVLREIPFSLIQFPLYEQCKSLVHTARERPPTPGEAALCGSVSGGFAAAITTPLDVIKTRVMLGNKSGTPMKFYQTFQSIIANEGPRALLSGLGPRVLWISIGGCIFLGTYEFVKGALE